MGTRLKELTKNNPKSLVKITENETIFSRAIKILSKFDIDKFIITTGYLNIILENYANNFSNISFKFIHNAEYETTNYIKSIDLIRDIDDDVILLHGDLIFSEEVAEKIINSKVTTVVIDSTIPLPKDDFKAKIMDNQVKCIGLPNILKMMLLLASHSINLKKKIGKFGKKISENSVEMEKLMFMQKMR